MKHTPATLLVFLGLALLAPQSAARAATVHLNPVSDAFVSSANAANNYGGGGALAVSAAGLPQGEFQTVMQFDLGPAKTSFDATFGAGLWTIQAINLQWTAASPNNAIFNTSAAGNFSGSWMQNDSWTEGSGTPMAPGASGITWNTLPSFLSGSDESLGTFSFNGATAGSFSYSLTLASGLVGDATGGAIASLRFAAADSAMAGRFNSRSFTTVSSRPVLAVTAVPEPAAFLLAAIGACGVFLWRRRAV